MIDSFGPRPTVPSGHAASVPSGQPGEKVVHRPPTRILPAEPVDKTAPTGPRPAFRHTYLEQAAAYWPDEPEQPVTRIAYEIPQPQPDDRDADDPTVDIRR